MKARRLAGYQLAALPNEDISKQLREALSSLDYSREPQGFSKEVQVPDTNDRVFLSARPTRFAGELPAEVAVYGNADQVELMKSLNSPGVLELQWSTDNGGGTPAERVRTARTADRAWKEAIKEIPENTIVINSPVGGLSGDYARSDLYQLRGFGGVQTDGQQLGYVSEGKIKPLQPLMIDERFAKHVQQRASAAGEPELAAAIDAQLSKRRDAKLDEKNRVSEEMKYPYEEDYDDYGYDDYEPQPVTRESLKEQIRYVDDRMTHDGYIPEVQYRQIFDNRNLNELSAERGDYIPTPDDIQQLRDLQVESLSRPSTARDLVDVIQNHSPRPTPSRISVEDLQGEQRNRWRLGSAFADIGQLPPEQRRQATIDAFRESFQYGTVGSSVDPSILRTQAKESATHVYRNPERGVPGYIAQELYTTEDIEALRALQIAQSRNWSVDSPPRVLPPTLSPDGSVASRRPTPEDAMESLTHLSTDSTTPTYHQFFSDGGTVVSRAYNPDAAAAERVVASAPPFVEKINRDLADLDGWFDSTQRGGGLFQEIYEAGSADELTAGITPERISDPYRDMRILHRAVSQPGNVDRQPLAQSVANLRQYRADGFGGVSQQLNEALAVLASTERGRAQVRRRPVEHPELPDPMGRRRRYERSSSPVPQIGTEPFDLSDLMEARPFARTNARARQPQGEAPDSIIRNAIVRPDGRLAITTERTRRQQSADRDVELLEELLGV